MPDGMKRRVGGHGIGMNLLATITFPLKSLLLRLYRSPIILSDSPELKSRVDQLAEVDLIVLDRDKTNKMRPRRHSGIRFGKMLGIGVREQKNAEGL